jgi:hypothetical protein
MVTLVLTDLSLDRMKAEEELQNAINSNESVEQKLINIKRLLRDIVTIDNMVIQWKNYMNTEEPNNN